MGIVVRLPFVPPKRRHSRLRRSGCNITAALETTNDGLPAFGAQAVILQQPSYLPIISSSICCSILGGTSLYLVVSVQYWIVLVSTWWFWVNIG